MHSNAVSLREGGKGDDVVLIAIGEVDARTNNLTTQKSQLTSASVHNMLTMMVFAFLRKHSSGQ